jgi:hypothetical protein
MSREKENKSFADNSERQADFNYKFIPLIHDTTIAHIIQNLPEFRRISWTEPVSIKLPKESPISEVKEELQ